MSNLFVRTMFFIGLTMMMSGAMPSATAYAIGNNFINAQAESDDAVPPATAAHQCQTVESIVTPDEIENIDDRGGSVVVLTGAQKDAFISRLSTLVGANPTYEVRAVVLVTPNGDDGTAVNVGIFSEPNGCIAGFLRLPPAVVEGLYSPNVSPSGERVD